MRAPGNAGGKRAKRKRGNRSVVAVAARIERGYLKRTAGGTACVNNHGDCRGTGSDGNGHPAAQTILAQERERLAQQVQSMASTPRQRVQAGVVDTRVIGKPDQFDGDPMKYADWSFKLRSYFGAVDQRYPEELTQNHRRHQDSTQTSGARKAHSARRCITFW